MDAPTITWTPLERGQLTAMRIEAGVAAVVLLGFAVIVDLGFSDERGWPFGVIAIPVALSVLYYAVVSVKRRFRRWGYVKTEDELLVAHGVLVHSETAVAFHRVQHIDIAQGPIERFCGVWQLVLNTAGTMNSRIRLPGLSRETAEALRDEIRQHIRADKE